MWDGWVGQNAVRFRLPVSPSLRLSALPAPREPNANPCMRCDAMGIPHSVLRPSRTNPFFILFLTFLPERANVPQTDRESESESETKTLRAALLRTQSTLVLRTNVAFFFFPSGMNLTF